MARGESLHYQTCSGVQFCLNRYNAPDDPCSFNKDGYGVFHFPNEFLLVVVDLDKKDDPEHWLNEIPDRLKNVVD